MTDPRSDDLRYPDGTVAALLDGLLLTPVTAAVLRQRLALLPSDEHQAALSDAQLEVLTAVAARLLPQSDRAHPIDLAGAFHRHLIGARGDGWRYADMPNDADAHRRGLDLVRVSARVRHGCTFAAAAPDAQDALLHDIQSGRIGEWPDFNPARWFEELLAELVDIYYSHPVALDEIGYAGFADARGWQDVGPGARAAHEPEPIS